MENKIIEFCREFNTSLPVTNEYLNLQYLDDGFTKAVKFPALHLFDNDNDSEDYLKHRILSRFMSILSHLQPTIDTILSDEIDKFFVEKKKQMTEKFNHSKLAFSRIAICRYKISVSGKYNEDMMADFLDVLKEDFQYVFEGLTLDVEY